MLRRIAAVLALGLLLGCQHVATHDDGTIVVRSFGAGTTTVAADGAVEVSSPGLSEGLSGVVRYAFAAVATFFRIAPQEPATIVVETPDCAE